MGMRCDALAEAMACVNTIKDALPHALMQPVELGGDNPAGGEA